MTESKTLPPPNTIVWLGAYSGYRHLHYRPTMATLTPRRGREVDAYFATVLVGRAVFQVFGHLYPEDLEVVPFGAEQDMAPQIWPIDRPEVAYPPGPAISEDNLKDFATRRPVGRFGAGEAGLSVCMARRRSSK